MIKTNHSRWFSILLLWLVIWPSLAASAEAPVILVLGDSLSAGYGIPAEQGWVSLLQRRLANAAYAEMLEQGEALPGVEPFEKRSLNFRVSSAK